MSQPHTAEQIRTHLYAAFLEARTADVALHVRGSWHAVYRLHRVVLIQAGFFRSLFDGGFLESAPKLGSHHSGPDEVDVTFEDPNITRAAFEICISRLYGGGPPLHLDPGLIPTPREPLTSSFPVFKPSAPTPQGHHPATPRILLSLLATAVYLSIPSIVSQALLLIMSSVGPHTAVRYLRFAIGSGIGSPADDEPTCAVGLEGVGTTPEPPSECMQSPPLSPMSDDGDSTRKLGALGDPPDSDSSESLSSYLSSSDDDIRTPPSFYYGPVSDKIGEAAACWLTRWGADILPYEEAQSRGISASASSSSSASLSRKPQRRATVSTPGDRTSMSTLVESFVPTIWARGGLDAKWVRAILSSDSFFIKGERDRYRLACRVVELRRRDGILEAEEQEWKELFANGIYYSHMALDDLISIAENISPTTNTPYVPLSVIQSAHWSQAILRQHVATRPSSGGNSPLSGDKGLGIAVTTAEILATLTPSAPNRSIDEQKHYYPVPTDSSTRVGDSSGVEGASMEQLFESPSQSKKGKRQAASPTSEANFFGMLSARHTAAACVTADNTGKARWSLFPPFRFAVEFWGVEALKEKSRLHSHTVWYAGSLFNVYVQVVRKKGLQLGVYLHRQSSVDPLPPASAPPSPMTRAERGLVATHARGGSLPTVSQPNLSVSAPSSSGGHSRPPSRNNTASAPPRSTTPASAMSALPHHPASSPPPSSSSASAPPTTTAVAPAQPYRDPRSAVQAYFTIVCASATGAALTRFSSAPDVFSVSQSWGWKSSSLRTEEYVEIADGHGIGASVSDSKEVSLRATVVLGIV